MLNRSTRYLLAAIEAIIGWEWLLSGANKLLSGTFPQGLADTLQDGLKNIPNGWYVHMIQAWILPNSVFYGYFIEWTELAVGLLLLGGALILIGEPRRRGEAEHNLAVAYSVLVILAAVLTAFFNVNFHFWMGGWVIPFFDPTAANNEAIDIDGLLPPLNIVIIVANIALIKTLRCVHDKK